MRGFVSNEAIIVGVESRTSTPVRIPRDRETLQHIQIKNLYPCAESCRLCRWYCKCSNGRVNCVNAIATLWLIYFFCLILIGEESFMI